ncbi:MAG: TonB-dependent receptor [Saprospiraceae bacterium]|nr:TonB-dependent receptor [Saprospiraceae bacterium]
MKHILFFFFFLGATLMSAQKYTLKGHLQDTDKNDLIGAVIVLLNPVDSVMAGYGVSDTKGFFNFGNIRAGNYNMQITYVGYGTIQRSLEFSGDEKIKDLGNIIMGSESQLLTEVVISAEYIPIKITKDTIEFNADAFKVQPNANVEELLKRLPGVEVDAEGNIKVQGEDVKAVTVDGKDFFGKDPKMATKNLPADAIKKVQVFDRKSRTSEFTGIDDGNEERTINLELKENRKGGSFGNVMAGYGSDNRYESKLMANKFAKKTQISFIASHNNINQTGISANDYSSLTGSSMMGGGRMGGGASGVPISWGPNNNGEISGGTLGTNFNYDFGQKSKINASYYLSQSKTFLNQSVATENFLPNGVFFSDQLNTSDNKGLNHVIFTNLDLKIDSTTELQFINNLSFRDATSVSARNTNTLSDIRESLNSSEQDQNGGNNGISYSGDLNFRKKLQKKGRTITADARYSNSKADDFTRLISEIYDGNQNLNLFRSVFQEQNGNNNSASYSGGLTFTEPLGTKWFLSLNASRRNNNSETIREFYDLDPETLTNGVFNEALSRAYDNTFVYNLAGSNFRFRNEKLNLSFGVEFQQSNLDGKSANFGEPISKNFNYFLPKASFQLENTNLRLNYSTSVREPSIDQLQPVADNSDPLNVYIGNPNLIPEYRHNMRIFYNFFDQFNFRSFFASVRLGHTFNRITTASFVDEFFVRRREPVNTTGESTVSSFLSYSSPLNFMDAKFRAGVNSSFTKGINFVQNVPTDINRWSNGFNVLLENKKKDLIDISVSSRFSFNNTIYKENRDLNNSFVNQTYEGNLVVYPGKAWSFDTKYEYFIFAQAGFTDDTKINLWQASVSKRFMNDKLTARVRVFDILNQNKGVSRSAVDNLITESISNSIGRYFMFSVQYNLTALGPAQPQQPQMRFMH